MMLYPQYAGTTMFNYSLLNVSDKKIELRDGQSN